MDCRLRGDRVEPLLARIVCDMEAVAALYVDRQGNPDLPWADDGSALLCFTAEEGAAAEEALRAARIPFEPKLEPQPDAAKLARLHGRVSSRSEARAFLSGFWVPCSRRDAEKAGLEYNAAAKGIAAFDAAERDDAAAKLGAIGPAPTPVEAKEFPQSTEELEARVKSLEAADVRPSIP